ncbi:MAG: hypothetical protein KC461_14140 [Dehalococcoidia bacterium]|nr:hypothetical protein [Dehalococcoidia bacterium]MCB9492339.1 hypothetical protein [Dehalococcoidia bacterium]
MKQRDRTSASLPVLVCRGSDCRGPAQERLCDDLRRAGADVVIVGCLDICKGPVALCPVGDRWEVVAKVRGKDVRKCVLQALAEQRARPLKKRMVRGKKRRKAIAKATKKLARRKHPAFAR